MDGDIRTFSFRSNTGRKVTVSAFNEADARTLAMRDLWGEETGHHRPRYRGDGLMPIFEPFLAESDTP